MSIRPKVSVCLASYNGQRYIGDQVRSILVQLSPSDELIVCDDASRDETRSVVDGIGDPRIIFHSFSSNVGHVRNFERAIASATGDLIFLSDQDDVWLPDKYRLIVQCFLENPEVQLVHHALALMDADGNILAELWNPLQNGRQAPIQYLVQQLIKCQVFGCAVAFRRSLVDTILPFPAITYAHDHWLAVAAGVCGPVFFLNNPLVRYRRHERNLTPRDGLCWRDRVGVRFRLLVMMAVAIFRRLRRLAA